MEEKTKITEKIKTTISKVRFVGPGVWCEFPGGITNNLYIFHDEFDQVEYREIRIKSEGYAFKPLDLLVKGEATSSPEKGFLIYHVSSYEERHPGSPNYSGNCRNAKSFAKCGFLGSEEDAKAYCKELTEKLRDGQIKERQKQRESSIKEVQEGRMAYPLELIIE